MKHVGVTVVLVGLVVFGCNQSTPSLDDSGLVSITSIATSLHHDLVENSVAVTSVTQPGIIFGLNDSGHDARVFAFDSTGQVRGTWFVVGARNLDWEAASLGPCRMDSAESCLYIGDVGDNDARKTHVSIYRLPEPSAGAVRGSTLTIRSLDRLDFRYADHPHDVEAMYVAKDGAVILITKRRLRDANGQPRRALVFRLAATAWDSSGIVTATLVDSLPIVPGDAPGRQVTDAALSPDSRVLAVRTYSQVFFFAVDSTNGLPITNQAPTACTILGLDERQGEGVGWWWDRRRVVLTSEGRNAPLNVVQCR